MSNISLNSNEDNALKSVINPTHSVTVKSVSTTNAVALGLENVTNESKTTMFTDPTFTGTPTAPTATEGTNTTQLATTAFVQAAVNTHDTLAELTDVTLSSLENRDIIFYNSASGTFVNGTAAQAGINASSIGLGNVANQSPGQILASAALTGVPTAPTATAGTNTTQVATTAFVLANQGTGIAIGELSNVNIDSPPADKELLTWHAASGQFINRTLTETGITATDLGVGSFENQSPGSLSISVATQAALDTKLAANSPTFTGTIRFKGPATFDSPATFNSSVTFNDTPTFPSKSVTVSNLDITKSDVGLGNVDNTSDENKPISVATQNALDLKVNANSPSTITGVLTFSTQPVGITKASVGLGNVSNQSPGEMAISAATQAALDLKANANSPVFTGTTTFDSPVIFNGTTTFNGTPSGLTATHVGLGNVANASIATILDNAALTNSPTAPTPNSPDNSKRIATTEFVQTRITSQLNTIIGGAPAALDTLNELAAALNDSPGQIADMIVNINQNRGNITTNTTNIATKAPSNAPTFTGLSTFNGTAQFNSPVTFNGTTTFNGTPSGLTKSHVGLGNVSNQSPGEMAISSATQTALDLKANLASPTFTGTVSGIKLDHLSDVDNSPGNLADRNILIYQSPSYVNKPIKTIFEDDTPRVAGLVVTSNTPAVRENIGLGNVTNESKATMFANPTFTGTISGITKDMVGLGNVSNQSPGQLFNSPTFTGTVSGITATHVGLGNVTNESKSTMFTNPTFTGTVSGVTKAHVGLSDVSNQSPGALFTDPTFTGTVSGVTKTHVGLGNVSNQSPGELPISAAVQAALDLKIDNSPFTTFDSPGEKTEVKGFKTTIDANASNITSLTNTVNTNAANITTNTTNIATNTTNISNLTTDKANAHNSPTFTAPIQIYTQSSSRKAIFKFDSPSENMLVIAKHGGNNLDTKSTNATIIGRGDFRTEAADYSILLGGNNQALNVVDANSPNNSIIIGEGNVTRGKRNILIGRSIDVADGAANTADQAIAIGDDVTINTHSTSSVAIGDGASVQGPYNIALGRQAAAEVTAGFATAIGQKVKTTVTKTTEVGYWLDATTRGGAVRVNGDTGQVQFTLQNRSTAYTDGGATAGAEANNTVLREGMAFRRDGNKLFVDINAGGTIKSKSLGEIADDSPNVFNSPVEFNAEVRVTDIVNIDDTPVRVKLTSSDIQLQHNNTTKLKVDANGITAEAPSIFNDEVRVTNIVNVDDTPVRVKLTSSDIQLQHNNTTKFKVDAGVTVSAASTFNDSVNVQTGDLTVTAGTAFVADKISHVGDTNTSIRFPSNDKISFETAGVEAMRIGPHGKVGIGLDIDSPSAALQVKGEAQFDSPISAKSQLDFGTRVTDDVLMKVRTNATSVSQTLLDAATASNAAGMQIKYEVNSVGDIGKVIIEDSSNSSAPHFSVRSGDGAVGIGSNSPSTDHRLSVGGTAFASAFESATMKATTHIQLPTLSNIARGFAISSPQNGMIIYNTDVHRVQVYANGAWTDLH